MNVHEYVADYEFRGEIDYTPTDGERAMLEDAIEGYLHDYAGKPPVNDEITLEKVARAICSASNLDPDFNYDPKGIHSNTDIRWRLFIPHAKAALAAA